MIGIHLTLVNVAQGKPAWQSSTHSPATAADRATDGNSDPDLAKGSCAVTAEGQGGASWWVVDLQREYNIIGVAVTNRGDLLGEHSSLLCFLGWFAK